MGSVDGKHVQIIPPKDGGSYYYNYKGHHSVVLMAIVNANYEFIMCDFGINGRISDGGVLKATKFYEKLANNELPIPHAKAPDNARTVLPYVFVGDEAFTLRKDFLKPFAQKHLNHDRRIFNYRLSRARRVVENVFGIMASRFRIFHVAINMKLENIDAVVMACCVLHNFLRKKEGQLNNQPNDSDMENMSHFTDLEKGHDRRPREEAKEVREKFLQYFLGDGAVSWQEASV